MAGRVGAVVTSRSAAVAAASASPFTPSSARRAGSALRMARRRPAITATRRSSRSNAMDPGCHGGPSPPGALPSDGGNRMSGERDAMAVMLARAGPDAGTRSRRRQRTGRASIESADTKIPERCERDQHHATHADRQRQRQRQEPDLEHGLVRAGQPPLWPDHLELVSHVPPAGLEPAAGGLEVHCSVQLSYGGGDGTVYDPPPCLGGRSSARLERQVVALEVGGSSPLGHPPRQAAKAVPDRCRRVATIQYSVGPGPAEHAPLAQLAEHRTLNPQVLGSSPRGRTTERPDPLQRRGSGLSCITWGWARGRRATRPKALRRRRPGRSGPVGG